ncbi:hypothetical protein ACWD5R_30005 [Streptomyces sp. NPDC002514]|uniref:hypothetical protein n=1 Tax=unclassified Streptomyces TaxID=2593676 RepID=UPI0036A1F0B9
MLAAPSTTPPSEASDYQRIEDEVAAKGDFDSILNSLVRRMSAMHSLWLEASNDMDATKTNHVERDGVLPIAFSLFHQANLQDITLVRLGGPQPVWNEEWADRIRLGVPDHGKDRSVDEMMQQRIGNYEAFCEYQRTVFDTTETWLRSLEPESLGELVLSRPLPELFARTFSARVADSDGLTRWDAIECWLFQHGIRHMGELEHARALVGLGGMTF